MNINAPSSNSFSVEMLNTTNYVPNIDGLRGISILIVLCSHFISPSLFPGGLGVYIFFVISGFLISRQLYSEFDQRGNVNLKAFYLRRFYRLYPVALFYTSLVVIVYKLMTIQINWVEPLSALFYFSNYLYSSLQLANHPSLMPFAIFWSLSVEEHFYFFPAIFIIFKGNAKAILFFAIFLITFSLAYRVYYLCLYPKLIGTNYVHWRTEFRIDSILFGVLISTLCAINWGRQLLRLLLNPSVLKLALIGLALCIIVRDPFFRATFRYTFIGFFLFIILSHICFTQKYLKVHSILNAPVLVVIGKLSYSLYIWHPIVPDLIKYTTPNITGFIFILIEFLLSFVISWLSYKIIERPFVRLRLKMHSLA